jgi:hypothetical protein
VQEIPIRPLVIKLPGERIERTFYQPVERQTEPLPVVPSIHFEMPATPPAAPHITVNVPERTRDERVPEQNTPDGNQRREEGRTDKPQAPVPVEAPPVVPKDVPSPEQKQFGPIDKNNSEPEQKPNKTHSGDEQKKVPPTNEINSETIPDANKNNSSPELFTPSEPSSQADVPAYKKKGKIGRQRKYDELGIDDIEPVKEVILLMHHTGDHWPGMSKDMRDYYDFWYFTRPNKRKDGKDYERHVKCYERKERWTAATPV